MIEVFQALQTPRRREILRLIWNREQCVGDIRRAQSDISFGAVSQHLRILEKAGLVQTRKDGVRHFYVARKEQLGPLQSWLEEMWNTALYRLKIRAELEQARRGPRSKKRRKHR